MADSMALKLLIAGVVGAVIGAAVAQRYHPEDLFPSGFDSPWLYRSWHGPVADDDDWRPGPGDREDWDWDRDQPQRYRPRPKPPVHTTCWRETEDWDFGTIRRPVPCDHRRRPWSS